MFAVSGPKLLFCPQFNLISCLLLSAVWLTVRFFVVKQRKALNGRQQLWHLPVDLPIQSSNYKQALETFLNMKREPEEQLPFQQTAGFMSEEKDWHGTLSNQTTWFFSFTLNSPLSKSKPRRELISQMAVRVWCQRGSGLNYGSAASAL